MVRVAAVWTRQLVVNQNITLTFFLQDNPEINSESPSETNLMITPAKHSSTFYPLLAGETPRGTHRYMKWFGWEPLVFQIIQRFVIIVVLSENLFNFLLFEKEEICVQSLQNKKHSQKADDRGFNPRRDTNFQPELVLPLNERLKLSKVEQSCHLHCIMHCTALL